MKLTVLLRGQITDGGGFNQSLNAILQIKSIVNDLCEVEVVTTHKESIFELSKFNIQATYYKLDFLDKLFQFYIFSKFSKLQKFVKLISPLEKFLISRSAGLVYFVAPDILCLTFQRLNYILTLWDLCHRDHPEFPEVRNYLEFQNREFYHNQALAKAFFVITDSHQLSISASQQYGVSLTKFISMPFLPSPYFGEELGNKLPEIILNKKYLFYPAQYWPHKNHIRILQSLLILKKRTKELPYVVFSGGDKGNLEYINNYIKVNGLELNVIQMGFVESSVLQSLYAHAFCVIMPTYFGPTNIPPIEAWLYNKPLIYTSDFKIQVEDAAILVGPDSALEIANAIEMIEKIALREKLIEAGRKRILDLKALRIKAESEIYKKLNAFFRRRECWSSDFNGLVKKPQKNI